jgi:hypothetical protein
MKIIIAAGIFCLGGLWADPINTYSAATVEAKSGYGMLFAYYPLVTGCFNERGVLVEGTTYWAPFNPSLWLGYAPLRHLELSLAIPYYSDFDTTNGFGDPLVQVKYQFVEKPVAAAFHLWLSLPLGAENLSSGSYDLTVGGLITKKIGNFTTFGNLYWTTSLPKEGNSISYNFAVEFDFADFVGIFAELNGYHGSHESQIGFLPGIALSVGEQISVDLGLLTPLWGKNCTAGWTPCGFVCYSF